MHTYFRDIESYEREIERYEARASWYVTQANNYQSVRDFDSMDYNLDRAALMISERNQTHSTLLILNEM